MNNSEILSKVFDLKDQIINSELYVDLKDKEKSMLNDSECFNLLCLYQDTQSNYNEAKRFENYGSNVENIGKELSDIKVKVEENTFVKEYNQSYKKMRNELKRIEKILFKDIVKEKKEIEIE